MALALSCISLDATCRGAMDDAPAPIHPSRTNKVGEPVHDPKVLIVCSYERAATSTRYQEDAIRKVIETQFTLARVRSDYLSPVTSPVESLTEDDRSAMAHRLLLKHASEHWDLIVCVDTLAFEILTKHCRELLDSAPLVFSGLVLDEADVQRMDLNATGIFERIDVAGTIRLAQRLRPETTKFLIVGQGSTFGRRLRNEAIRQLQTRKTSADVRWSTATTLPELVKEASSLGADGAVIYLSFYDPTPMRQDPWGVVTEYPVPVYGMFRTYIEPNMLGGCVVDPEREGAEAGARAVKILSGASARSIPPSADSCSRVVLSNSAILRWNIPKSRIPSDALILGQPKPWRERYLPYVGWVVLAVAAQGGIIGLLLLQRQRRLAVERELRKSKDRVELAMKNSTEGVWDWDIASDEVYWSGALRERLGIPDDVSTSRTGPTREWEKRVHPDDLAAAKKALQDHLKHRTQYDIQYRIRVNDGKYRWYRSRGAAERDAGGRPFRMIGSMTDVHEQVEAGQRVRESEARFRALFERNLEATFIVNDQGVILDVNPAGLALFAVPRDRLVSRRVQDFDSPPDRPSVAAAFAGYFEGHPRGSFAIVKDAETGGGIVEVEFSAASLGGGLHAVILRDVTDRLRIERELFERERRYRLATEAGRISVWEVETKSFAISADALLVEQLTGDRAVDLGSNAEKWFSPLHPDDLPIVHERFDKCMAGEIDTYELVIRSIWNDKRVRWLNVRGTAVHGPDGSVVGVIGTAQDVTEREEAFSNLRRIQERLAAITDNVPGLVYHSVQFPDGGQQVEYVSRGAKDVIGIDASDMVGKVINPLELVEPADAHLLLNASDVPIGTGGKRQIAFRLRTPTGKVRWVRDLSRYWRRDDGSLEWDGIIIDQTEVREAAERLAQSEKRYRNIVETAEEGIWLVGPDWKTTFVNSRMAGILGTTPEYMVGRSIDEFMDDEGKTIAAENKRRREQGIREQHEFKFTRVDGTPVWTLVSTNAIHSDTGAFQGALAMVTDITERREAQLALLRERSLFLGGPAVAWRWRNADGWPVEYVSANIASFGYSPEDFMSGRISFAELIHPDDMDRVFQEVSSYVAKREAGFEQEYRLRAADGRWRWVADRTVVEYDAAGKASGFAGYTIDVTERVAAERKLRESEQRLRLLVNSTPLGVIYFTRDFTITQWNAAAERIFGFPASEVIGKSASMIVPPSERAYVEDVWNKLLKQRGGSRGTNQNIRKDGKLIFCEWYNSTLVDDAGQVIAVASVVEDITERRVAERQQRLLMTELDHRVKNNLAAVMSLAEQTAMTTPDNASFISAFSQRLRALAQMHKLLASSKWEHVDLAVLVRQTLDAYAQGGVDRATCDGPSIPLGPRASQVIAMTLNELATNAAKYGALSMPRGHVRVTWELPKTQDASSESLIISWQESGGPPVVTPSRRGLGSAFIEGAVAHELGGTTELFFPPTGVVCVLKIPKSAATANDRLIQVNPES